MTFAMGKCKVLLQTNKRKGNKLEAVKSTEDDWNVRNPKY